MRGSVPGLHRVLRSTLSERARAGKDWLYEIKADGYREQLHLRAGRTTIYSRTKQFRRMAEAAEKLRLRLQRSS
jgi:bifunctional non-homologous end joining protein LigD